jgi:hypothetical protein
MTIYVEMTTVIQLQTSNEKGRLSQIRSSVGWAKVMSRSRDAPECTAPQPGTIPPLLSSMVWLQVARSGLRG